MAGGPSYVCQPSLLSREGGPFCPRGGSCSSSQTEGGQAGPGREASQEKGASAKQCGNRERRPPPQLEDRLRQTAEGLACRAGELELCWVDSGGAAHICLGKGITKTGIARI